MGAKMPDLAPNVAHNLALRQTYKQKWCRQGIQASTVFGHNLSMRTCSACFLGMPAKFGGQGEQGVAPGKR
eukprot:1161602-Pelagomonas_calceolata.AAC.14